jgi:hypothetical protein
MKKTKSPGKKTTPPKQETTLPKQETTLPKQEKPSINEVSETSPNPKHRSLAIRSAHDSKNRFLEDQVCEDQPDPFAFMAKLFPRASVSLLAVLADYGGLISGSRSLDFFFPSFNCTTEESDIDIYIPGVPRAIEATVHVLSFCGVLWRDTLSNRLDDIKTCGMTLLPYWAIYTMTRELLQENRFSPEQFRKLLYTKLSYHEPVVGSRLIKDFVDKLTDACSKCQTEYGFTGREGSTVYPKIKNYIWVYYGHQEKRPKKIEVPKPIIKLTEKILELLDTRHENDDCKHFKTEDEEKVVEAISHLKQFSQKYKDIWTRKNLHEDLLPKYMSYRMIKQRPQHSRAEMYGLIDDVLGLRKETQPGFHSFNLNYGPEMRILRGRLPDGKVVQLIVVPPDQGRLLKSVILRFYSTHVMSFISGTVAGHLYRSTAKGKKGLLLDFREDKRQSGAELAIQKWSERGWVFEKLETLGDRSRAASDEDAKIVDMESSYIAALGKMGKVASELPNWWKCYFRERTSAVKMYTWLEKKGKIRQINHEQNRMPDDTPRLSEWVHTALDGHEGVMPEKEWKSQDTPRIRVDLWFGGLRIPTCQEGYRITYDSLL